MPMSMIRTETNWRALNLTYAQELNKRLGPVTIVKDKIEDVLETAIKKVSATSKSASDIKNSTAVTLSQYTQAARDKMNELKPTIGANHEPGNPSSPADGKEITLNERMAENSEKGHHDASSIAENVNNKTPAVPDAGRKLLAAGGDDVFKVMADGASTQEDPLKGKHEGDSRNAHVGLESSMLV